MKLKIRELMFNIKLMLLKKLGINQGEMFYINGSENLPAPLEKDKETIILEQIMIGNFENRELLVVHNLRLVVYIAKKFENTGINIEDLISIGTIGLIKAVNTFKPDKKIKLATYASRCIENEILMHLRKTVNQKNEVSIDEPLNVDWDGNELLLSDILGSDSDVVNKDIELKDEKNILLNVVNQLNERERQIMIMRFGLGDTKEYTQKQVADALGISQSYISRLEKKIIEKLKKHLEKVY